MKRCYKSHQQFHPGTNMSDISRRRKRSSTPGETPGKTLGKTPGRTPGQDGQAFSLRAKGGRFKPLTDDKAALIVERAFAILETVGMADAPDWLRQYLLDKGASQRADGRITFARAAVEAVIARSPSTVALPGFVEELGLEIGGGRVHIGTGGAAVEVLDPGTGAYRPSTLADLYRLMRIVDRSQHIHYGVRPVVARDMKTPFDLDINTAFACLKATGKPIGVSFDSAGHVGPVIEMFDIALGGAGTFRKQPFCMAIIVHAVSPLRFATEGVEAMREAIDAGMPLQICTAAQAGATSPASLAGALAQGLAETLAGMMVVDAIRPGHPTIYAFMPFISDLRTGAMSGGSGEAAIANAAAAQILLSLALPSTVSAGMTDSKLADAQAGYEKGYTISQVAHAGADMINLSVGMLGSIMVASPEMMVIDNEMCGAILRSVHGIDVDPERLDIEEMDRVVSGDGHFLGEPRTLALMRTEYLYPVLSDRRSVADWAEAGSEDIWARAERHVKTLLLQEPEHLPPRREDMIRQRFDIHLDRGN